MKKVSLLFCLTFSSLLTCGHFTDQSLAQGQEEQEDQLILRWKEDGEEKEFKVEDSEEQFFHKYVMPLVTKIVECKKSGARWANFFATLTAVGAMGSSWYLGISGKMQRFSKYCPRKISLPHVALFFGGIVGGITSLMVRSLVRKGISLFYFKKEADRVKKEIKKMLKCKDSVTEMLFLSKLQFKRIRILFLWNALKMTVNQYGCSDDIKRILFGFDKPQAFTNDHKAVIAQMLNLDPVRLFLNPHAELRKLALPVC
ncbi:hypothetical protein E3J79_01060 [Candidatus Dependentiae bacterium]|nr:MAG: hypothetical protein E3J79_01060 [Candidatus Dependentiae bacterium]